jgi:sulfate/thiosulfate-binding protein
MTSHTFRITAAVLLAAGTVSPAQVTPAPPAPDNAVINASTAPGPGLWQALYKQYNAGAAENQRRPVRGETGANLLERLAGGAPADLVTLSSADAAELLRQKGLLPEGWSRRLPHSSTVFSTTVVFLVRKGNPKKIADWRDLGRSDVRVVTPPAKTSTTGKATFLAVWGSVTQRRGTEAQARDLAERIYATNAPILVANRREGLAVFVEKGQGDVYPAWEAEARKAVEQSGGDVEIVTPALSIRQDVVAALLPANAERRGTRADAQGFLHFLFTDAAQETIARHGYRPVRVAAAAKASPRFPEVELFTPADLIRDPAEGVQRFFGDGALFDRIRAAGKS